ncbi:hypothetical protein IT397_00170 [Candidatus Nomurabacteria bacterium]|nr:hypothetical protein [Candidatus Nomurabacteria bacterium]
MNIKEFVMKFKNGLRIVLICVAIIIPLGCVVAYTLIAMINSLNTTQIATYWLPENHIVVKDYPKAEKVVWLNSYLEFQKLASKDNLVIAHVTGRDVQYFVKVGSSLIASPMYQLVDYNGMGMSFDYQYRLLKDGRVEITSHRSYIVIALGIIFSLIGGLMVDAMLVVGYAILWVVCLDNIQNFLWLRSPLCAKIFEEWQKAPSMFLNN